jgi:hypothetical protein
VTALVDEHPHLEVECVLRELHIASSTYYRWRRREKEPCERQRRDVELTEQIRQIHQESGGIYGSPRVHAVLRREGVGVGRKRVERLMRQAELAGISPRRKGFTRRDPQAALAPDLVNRDFTAQAPNRLWVTDLTMISTGEGPLWLSAIRDAFSRRVVAWETSARADADLVLTTLEYALASCEVVPGQLIHHADHGCQGGFNRSSQHLIWRVFDGKADWLDLEGDGAAGDAFAGATSGSSGCGAGVLGEDRGGAVQRGGGDRLRCFRSGGIAMVPCGRWYADFASGSRLRQVSLLR